MKRLHSLLLPGAAAALASALAFEPGPSLAATRPNVLLILTDDQGHGDVGFHQNPKIRTPSIDRLAREGVRFERFHVSPVCSPTRASLMTGRYCFRTGVVDTYLGRSMMFADEVTIAQMLAGGGYRTAIYGKWHLGDNYPMRAMDKGFQESLVLNGGGLAQPGDPPFAMHPDGAYFDPWLRHNGQWERQHGYVTDVLTDAALRFISRQSSRPFFIYLAYNAPHVPLQVPEKYYARYRDADLTVPQSGGHPVGRWDHETTARVYAMCECIDDNIGRLLARLDELKIAENTMVIFLTDNGPQQPRYNSGLLDLKGNTHEGGVRVPFFVRWPGHFEAGRAVGRIAAHIDVAPTLLELCGVPKPAGVRFDGISLVPLLKGESGDWPERTLYFQWHRGDVPELNRACAAVSQPYKLVQPRGAEGRAAAFPPRFELYDYAADPLEMTNLAAAKPEVVARMREGYEAWFKDVTSGRDYSVPPRIWLGAPEQAEVLFTRQDWRGPDAGWTPKSIGCWFVDVRRPGEYAVTLRFAKASQPAIARLELGSVRAQQEVGGGATTAIFPGLSLPPGPARLEAVLESAAGRTGMEYVEVRFLK
ncbi:MAG: arylsulfatase [Verrucomicrobiota bacterium]